MAVRGSKRRASTASPAPAELNAKRKCAMVAKELATASDCPGQLLASLATRSLLVLKSERHPYHKEVVETTGQVLESLYEAKKKFISDAKLEAQKSGAEKKARSQQLEEAKVTLSKLEESFVAETQKLKEAAERQKAARTAAAEAKAAQRDGDKELTTCEKERTTILSAITIIDAGSADAEGVEGVLRVCREHNLDALMLRALPSVLKEAADARSDFAEGTARQCADALQEKIAPLDEKIAESAPGKEERAGASEAAESELAAAKQAEDVAKDAIQRLGNEVRECKAALKSASAKVDKYYADMKKLMDGLDTANVDFEYFSTGPLKYFAELKEMDTPAEVIPAEEAENQEQGKDDDTSAVAAIEGASVVQGKDDDTSAVAVSEGTSVI